jgi:hypothetical protein
VETLLIEPHKSPKADGGLGCLATQTYKNTQL